MNVGWVWEPAEIRHINIFYVIYPLIQTFLPLCETYWCVLPGFRCCCNIDPRSCQLSR